MKINYKDEFFEASLTLRPASLRDIFACDDMKASVSKEFSGIKEKTNSDIRLYFQKLFVHPSCVCCVQDGFINIKHDVDNPKKPGEKKTTVERIDPRAITFDKFLDLPNAFLSSWVDGAWTLNSKWKPLDPEVSEAELENGKKT